MRLRALGFVICLFFLVGDSYAAALPKDQALAMPRSKQDNEWFEKPSEVLKSSDNAVLPTKQDQGDQPIDSERVEDDDQEDDVLPRINKIIITGNNIVTSDAIINKIPYRLGEQFNPSKTSTLIRNLHSMGYFRQIELYGEEAGPDLLNLHIKVIEKKKLEEVKYEGNKHLNDKEIKKKIDFSKVPAIDEEELTRYSEILRRLLIDKGYHFAKITPRLEIDGDKATAVFVFDENKASVVKQIVFKGNKKINAKKLRSIMFTREDWVMSFMDSAGTFHPDAVEMDRYTIETFYKNNGYIMAKVIEVDVDMDNKTKNFYLTFHIEEGPQYRFGDIKVPGNDIMSEETLLRMLPLKKGDLYSQAKIQRSLEILRTLWGEHGYIYADVEPSIQPNEDTKLVNVALYTELGNKVRLNRINITGNKKSRDKIIRRQIALNEGEMLTTKKMDFSKSRVELLGYFDKRDGVNWKINRISDDLCDLDLVVKEVRTGTASVQFGTGGNGADSADPITKFNASIGFSDTNFLGRGIQYDIGTVLSAQEQSGHFNIMNPWLFDKPISGALSLYASRAGYEDIHSVRQQVNEKRVGGSGGLGFFLSVPRDTHYQLQAGVEKLSYGNQFKDQLPEANLSDPAERREFQMILDRRFQIGTIGWVTNTFEQDLRNHPMHPSRGYHWLAILKGGATIHRDRPINPSMHSFPPKFSFIKFEADAAWYTPLIGENELVLCLHGHFGIVHGIKNHTIPYRELFNVGGPATVRGFLFGQISPMWKDNAIGGTKAFWVNTELIFPINPDFTIKGAVFYDGGAGWDTPDAACIDPIRLHNNSFNYRHAVGIGVRLLNPFPLQVDWGFKLDRNKKLGEPVSELHLTMNHNF